jgi:glutamyl-tRNA synthetase
VQQFREEGFLPDALVNFLALLGWSFDDATEIFSREELIKHFTLERVNKAAAVCDLDKLRHLNGWYLRNQPREKTVALAREYLRGLGLLDTEIYRQRGDTWLDSIIGLEIERSRVINDFGENLRYFFDRPVEYEAKSVKKLFLPVGTENLLEKICGVLQGEVEMTPESLDSALRLLAEREGLGYGKLAQPVRLALTGRSASPGLYDVIIGLGREECIERLKRAARWIAQERRRQESETTIS